MGASESRPRKLTIENNNPMSVIKVSDEVVERMKGKEGVSKQTYSAGPQQVPVGQAPFLYEPSLTSIQIRQSQVQALKDNDDYWDKRIECLQQGHEQMHKIMEQEFQKAVEEGKITKMNNEKTIPCTHKRADIIACYKKYKDEPMRCAKEVQQFAECVEKKRAALIANRG
ncbi:PREDICTED: MICOS complex subunit MIC19 [Nicrophorus vespilloides]|uniref:MICOS complex subunit MIC19 n=1 Tax=Nicrophorus vespilloides TaxID=110193 RepID=A0ABM1NHG6_NICVS|nr:PREDICTED: MICOS complex subunit MIC19 [Nicrophorus vespilloides]